MSSFPSPTVRPSRTEDIVILAQDEAQLIEAYRRAKRMGYADINVTIQEGTRVKLWLTEKMK